MADQKELEENVEPKSDEVNEDADKSGEPEQPDANLSEDNDWKPLNLDSARKHNKYLLDVEKCLPILGQYPLQIIQAIYETCVNAERNLLYMFRRGVVRGQHGRGGVDWHSHGLVIIRNKYKVIRNQIRQIIQNHPDNGQ